MTISDEYVALICPQCGGQVEIDQVTINEHFVELEGAVVVYLGTIAPGGEGATCEHCGTRFQRRQRLAIASGGRASIAGNVTVQNGDFVGGDKITVIGGGAVATSGGVAIVGDGNVVVSPGDVRRNRVFIGGSGNVIGDGSSSVVVKIG